VFSKFTANNTYHGKLLCIWYIIEIVLRYYSTFGRCDYQLVFNINPRTLDKGERLEYGESMMTHAMVFTAVNEKQVTYKLVCMYVCMYVRTYVCIY